MIISILMTQQAMAQSPALIQYKALYDFTFAGLRFGKLGIEINETASDYSMTSDIASAGVTNLFTRHTSHSTAEGKGDNFTFKNRSYESHYKTNNKPRYVKLVYKNDVISEELAEPAESPDKRPVILAAQKDGSYDLLGILLKIRQLLMTQTNQFDINAYDGRRLMKTHFSVVDRKNIEYQHKIQPIILVKATRQPLAGFSNEELANYKPDEPPLFIYFSDDARMLPLKLELTFWLGTIHANLVKECSGAESCLLPTASD